MDNTNSSLIFVSVLKVPLVVRLEGTNVDAAKKILAESDVQITAANDLDDPARQAVMNLAA